MAKSSERIEERREEVRETPEVLEIREEAEPAPRLVQDGECVYLVSEQGKRYVALVTKVHEPGNAHARIDVAVLHHRYQYIVDVDHASRAHERHPRWMWIGEEDAANT